MGGSGGHGVLRLRPLFALLARSADSAQDDRAFSLHRMTHFWRFADAAGEEFGGLENGGADFLEVVGAEDVADGGFDEVPERRVGREQVAGASGGFDHVVLLSS